MKELSRRDTLYNAVLKTVKEYGTGMEIGDVRAVLGEVEGAITMRAGRLNFDTVSDKMMEKTPQTRR